MTKAYKGFDALFRMKEVWIKKDDLAFNAYMYDEGKIKTMNLDTGRITESDINVNFFFRNTFVDYMVPLEAGDPVKITTDEHTYYGSVLSTGNTTDRAPFVRIVGSTLFFNAERVERITPEELVAAQREQVFKNAGRKLDEFRQGDIVTYSGVEAIVSEANEYHLRLTGEYHGYVKVEEVTPCRFATYEHATAPVLVKNMNRKLVAPCTSSCLEQAIPNLNSGGRL